VEAQPPHVAGAVHHPYNDGLGRRYAEIDVVVAVHGEAKAGRDLVARNAAVAQAGYSLQMTAEVRKVVLGGCDAVFKRA
jgi:hypothetical protein